MSYDFSESEARQFIPQLLIWFAQNRADLPWRRTNNPYHIWLSEIMLQQTQVTTVIPYYERFLERFPSVEALAAAPQDDLMKQWEGLGYYSRARNLQVAAQQVVKDHGGIIPQSAEALQQLKGIGRYTAGAIASIAFGQTASILDGNVIRVFTRLFDIDDDVRQSSTKNDLWALADSLIDFVPKGKAGDYNEALMELGRTICKPRNPLCSECPVAAFCQANANNTQDQRPVKSRKPPTPHYDVTCGLIWNDKGELLITKRRDGDLLGGLWEFPGGKVEDGETKEACLARELHEELGISVRVGDFFIQVKHAYTHFKITLHAFECQFDPAGGDPFCHECAEWRWINPQSLTDYAFPRADRHIIEALHDRPNWLL
jgi:A/G-specific adenine glycosylase